MNSAALKSESPVTPAKTVVQRGTSWELWAVAAVYFLVCLAIQWRSHAGAAGFGTYPDEPAHYVGGLLIRDYAVSGMSQSPLAFAQEYYKHVPYFAAGYWPPVFYCFEALWVLLFGPARSALLMLSALFAVGSASLIFFTVRREVGALAGFCGGMLFLAVPEVQRQICTTMVDLPVTFGVLAATVLAVRYLESGRWRDSIGFAVLAGGAFLTKYSAAYVCVVPVLAILALRRWRLLRAAPFWVQPVIVIALIGPWLYYTAELGRQLMQLDFVGVPGHGRDSIPVRLGLFLEGVIATMPWPAWIVIAIGLAAWLFRPSRWNVMGVSFVIHFVAMLAFLIASSVLNERRYFTPGVAALVIAGLCGWKWLERYSPRGSTAGLLACTALAFVWGSWAAPVLRVNDLHGVVERVLAEPRWQNASVFVASEAEGPMIAEFAMRDPARPKRRLIRPGKVLAADNWFGASYRSFFQQPSEVQALLTDLQVGVVILRAEQRPEEKQHDVLLRQAVAGHPEAWRHVTGGGPAYEIFEPVRHRAVR